MPPAILRAACYVATVNRRPGRQESERVMGSNGFRFYLNPCTIAVSDRDTTITVLTPGTLTFRRGNAIAVIECRLPRKGERAWQCWTDLSLDAQMGEMLGDWGADEPGWEASGTEANGDDRAIVTTAAASARAKAADPGPCFYVTILAAFALDEAWTFPECKHVADLAKDQGFDRLKPGTQARIANARDAIGAKFTAELVKDYKATTDPIRLKRVDVVRAGANDLPAGDEAQSWLGMIMPHIDRMEEIGGPSDADYLEVMEYVAAEAARRAKRLRMNLGRTEVATPPQTLTIELTIDGDIDDAADIVDNVLDGGTLQDAILEYASDHDKDIDITSAVLK